MKETRNLVLKLQEEAKKKEMIVETAGGYPQDVFLPSDVMDIIAHAVSETQRDERERIYDIAKAEWEKNGGSSLLNVLNVLDAITPTNTKDEKHLYCAAEVASRNDLCGKPAFKNDLCKRHYKKLYGW